MNRAPSQRAERESCPGQGHRGSRRSPGAAYGDTDITQFAREAMPLLDRLYAAAIQMACDHADAEMLVQQTYLQAFHTLGSPSERISLKVWLFRTLADTALGACGERNLQRSSVLPTAGSPQRLRGERNPRPCDDRALKTHALDQLPDDEVTAALQQLPTELRIVVYLADVEDFPPTEIAEILGLSPGTATSRLRRGHDSLLQTLTDAARRRGLPD